MRNEVMSLSFKKYEKLLTHADDRATAEAESASKKIFNNSPEVVDKI